MTANPEVRPKIIQGGMGVGVSNWFLAHEVARFGQEMGENVLGVVSGAALGIVVARLLQNGDSGGHYRRAFNAFPYPDMAERVWDKWFIAGGRTKDQPYKLVPMANLELRQDVTELIILANFAEVRLAKEGHDRPIGINYLEKIQTPRLPELFGAVLAGVDFVLMGAGIPDQVPGVLDKLAEYQPASYSIDIDGRRSSVAMNFDPAEHIPESRISGLKRPDFLAIVSSNILAKALVSKEGTKGRVDGFVLENHEAGGHNTLPRGQLQLNESGEPVYGEKDEINLEEMRTLRRPFWLAGSYTSPQKLKEALSEAKGAAGIQAGTIFALCEESGLLDGIKQKLIELAFGKELDILADPRCSSSGFPFNVVQLPGTMSDSEVYKARKRVCDIGCLRQAHRTPGTPEKPEGTIVFRCPAGPVSTYVNFGGRPADTESRKCLCNSLPTAVGLGQIRNGAEEPPIITLGRNTDFIEKLVGSGGGSYSAREALAYLLGN